jgi:Flp pilus assembly protein TadD
MPQVSVQDALRLAQQHRDAGRFRDAESIYREILAQRPDHAESHHQLGLLAYHEGRHEAAVESLGQAIALRPERWNFHTNLGAAFAALDRPDEAIAAYLRALELEPDRAETYNNVGIVYRDQDRLDLAMAALDRAIALEPGRAEFHTNRGAVLEKLGLFEAAVWAHRRAIEIIPSFAEGHFNLATSLLVKGELAEGWDEYEWRWRCQGFQTRPSPYLQPRWDGGDPAGRTLLLCSEQGMGDTIQFARYASLVSARGARVVLGCPAALQSLLRTVPGVAEVVTDGTKLPPFDLQIPLMSLPGIFGTTVETIPAKVPYVAADPEQAAAWGAKLAARAPALNVGLVWAGHPQNRNDRRRSIPLSAFSALTDVPGVVLHSLQSGQAARQIEGSPVALVDQESERLDFLGVAGLVAELDLVITVDTAVAHLAGALGKPVWTLLPFAPDWRWLLGREDTPWYPTMRLFRQAVAGDWDGVLTRVASELASAALASSHDRSRHPASSRSGR